MTRVGFVERIVALCALRVNTKPAKRLLTEGGRCRWSSYDFYTKRYESQNLQSEDSALTAALSTAVTFAKTY